METTGNARTIAKEVNKRVGEKIRARRASLGLTQMELATAVGVTYQQMHKYERGVNRVSAGMLAVIAHKLGAPMAYFFDGAAGALNKNDRIALEMGRSFAKLPHLQQRALLTMARVMAGDMPAPAAEGVSQ